MALDGGGGLRRQLQLTLASVPKPVRGSFQGQREGGYSDGGKSGKDTSHTVKKLRDFNSKELSDLIAGAVFFLGLFGYFAYFVVRRDEREKQNEKNHSDAKPK